MRRGILLGSVVVVMALALPASAATTVTATDPAGDTESKVPGYLDLVSATATEEGQTFVFTTQVADPIPSAAGKLSPAKAARWVWGIDTDPTTAPKGTPVSPGHALPVELVLWVTWDGNSFAGSLIDRRPLLTGGEAIVTPLPFVIQSNLVSMTVAASAIGDPTSFRWNSATILLPNQGEDMSFRNADFFVPAFNPSP